MKRDILYVDDEMDNLVVFRATLGKDFNVWIANSGERALEMLKLRSFPVVIADQRMPHMTGSALFEIIRRLHPHTKRIMLTGYFESKAMVDAINMGQIYYFIKKPWERDVVQPVLVRAIEAYDLAMSNMALTERLASLDRCAMLGRTAAQVAHEMSNQLCCMLPLLELLEEDQVEPEDLVQTAAFARKTYERLVQLVNEVKAFVRLGQEDLSLQPLSVSHAIHELIEFAKYSSMLPIAQLSVNVQAEAYVKANKFKLQQVLINLLKNAAHAIRDKAAGCIKVSLSTENGDALLSVQDNGCGMNDETAARIWEPFFTTKGPEGTGLGLDVSRAIIETHGGQIDFRTALGQGTTFIIRLPLAHQDDGSESAFADAPLMIDHPPLTHLDLISMR